MLKYINGDAIELRPEGAYLAHACNAQGVAGAGIAAQIAKRYPLDLYSYEHCCEYSEDLTGHIVYTAQNKILWLITSYGFGAEKDDVETILLYTKRAILELNAHLPKDAVVYSNRFNSGLFAVPWERTESLLVNNLREDITWVVVDYKK
jgi:ADP-ribose 1''-phosphate phosphatase